jgi:hypothetical protein
MDLVARVKNILLKPKDEWRVIDGESGDTAFLYRNYVCILAAIPPVCSFIGSSLIGYGPFHVGIGRGLVYAVVSYVLALVSVFVVAYVIDFLAGVFGGRRDLASAMKVSAYAPTAAWLAGVFSVIPFLGLLGVLGLYSLYLLHTGIASLMRPPADKSVIYTIAVVVCVIVIWIVIVSIPAMMIGMPGRMML